jgi:sugar phosphate isomerase/epimerase
MFTPRIPTRLYPGGGHTDFPALFAALKQSGYKGDNQRGVFAAS